jgi:hypothetical protein
VTLSRWGTEANFRRQPRQIRIILDHQGGRAGSVVSRCESWFGAVRLGTCTMEINRPRTFASTGSLSVSRFSCGDQGSDRGLDRAVPATHEVLRR